MRWGSSPSHPFPRCVNIQRVTSPLCASVPSSVKWGQLCLPHSLSCRGMKRKSGYHIHDPAHSSQEAWGESQRSFWLVNASHPKTADCLLKMPAAIFHGTDGLGSRASRGKWASAYRLPVTFSFRSRSCFLGRSTLGEEHQLEWCLHGMRGVGGFFLHSALSGMSPPVTRIVQYR